MKKTHFILAAITVCVFLLGTCKLTIEVDNLLEEYDLSVSAYIWNNYMPGASSSRRFSSICSVQFESATKLPPMKVSATIITEKNTIQTNLSDIYHGTEPFLKDFRPIKGFFLNAEEEYTIEVTVKISGKQQTIIFENQIVGGAM